MRPLLRVLLSPPLVGALVLLAASAVFTWGPIVDPEERMLGSDAAEVAEFVRVRYADTLIEISIVLGLATAAVGASLGLLSWGLLSLRRRLSSDNGPGWTEPLLALLSVMSMHSLWLLVSMTAQPQLYSSVFYAKGGVLRSIQLFATGGYLRSLLLLLAFVSLLVLGAPWRWPRRLRTLAELALAHPLRTAFCVSVLSAVVCALFHGAAPHELLRRRATKEERPLAKATEKVPNVLLLAVDSLRHDRLTSDIAPAMHGLAQRGVSFERAYVTIARTFPSWATILTGKHVFHHGIRSTFAGSEERAALQGTLLKHLSSHASSVVSDYAGDIFDRAPFGFGTTLTPRFSFREAIVQRALLRDLPLLPFAQTPLGRALFPALSDVSAAATPFSVADVASREIRRLSKEPFFVTVFFSTPHFPYAAPYPYYKKYTTPSYMGPYKFDKAIGLSSEPDLARADIEQTRGLYNGAVRAVDDAVAQVLATLDSEGVADDTIVVLTADHGESLFEAGHWQGHGDHLFGDEGFHVPLVVYDPRRPNPHREQTLVSAIDIAPTLSELCRGAPLLDADGVSLVPLLRGETLAPRPVFGETELWLGENPAVSSHLRMPSPSIANLLEVSGNGTDDLVLRPSWEPHTRFIRHRMVFDGTFKLVYAPTRRGPGFLLFDALRDPDNLQDLFRDRPVEAARLRKLLESHLAQDPKLKERGGLFMPKESLEDGAPAKQRTRLEVRWTESASRRGAITFSCGACQVDARHLAPGAYVQTKGEHQIQVALDREHPLRFSVLLPEGELAPTMRAVADGAEVKAFVGPMGLLLPGREALSYRPSARGPYIDPAESGLFVWRSEPEAP